MPGDDEWQPVIEEIGDQVREMWRRGPRFEQSFFVRSVGRQFAHNGVRRLLVGIELKTILPNRPFLAYVRTVVAESSQLAGTSGRRLDEYVSLTRADFHPLDKLACDWCAIANGVLTWTGDLLEDALESGAASLRSWRFDRRALYGSILSALRFVPLSVVSRNYDRARVGAALSPLVARAQQHLEGAALKEFARAAERFVVARHVAACIEMRYCPFRHLRELRYSPAHCLFDSRLPEHVEQAARVLSELGQVECHECTEQLAASPLQPVDDRPSILARYYELLLEASASRCQAVTVPGGSER